MAIGKDKFDELLGIVHLKGKGGTGGNPDIRRLTDAKTCPVLSLS